MTTKNRSKSFCACGVAVNNLSSKRHLNSITHKHGERIRSLVAANCVSNREIAKRLGITAERVRQIVAQLGLTNARVRQNACAISKGIRYNNPLFELLADKCNELGYAFELIKRPVDTCSGRGQYKRSAVKINGHVCRILRASYQRKAGYCVIHPSRYAFDFAILRFADKWLIIPAEKMPKKQTGFALEPKINIRNLHNKHNWRDYIENWSQLATKKTDAG